MSDPSSVDISKGFMFLFLMAFCRYHFCVEIEKCISSFLSLISTSAYFYLLLFDWTRQKRAAIFSHYPLFQILK